MNVHFHKSIKLQRSHRFGENQLFIVRVLPISFPHHPFQDIYDAPNQCWVGKTRTRLETCLEKSTSCILNTLISKGIQKRNSSMVLIKAKGGNSRRTLAMSKHFHETNYIKSSQGNKTSDRKIVYFCLKSHSRHFRINLG